MLCSAAHDSLQEIMPYHFMEPSRRFGCSPGVAPTLVGTLAPPDPFLKPFRSWRTVEQACYNFRAKKGIDQSVAVRIVDASDVAVTASPLSDCRLRVGRPLAEYSSCSVGHRLHDRGMPEHA